MSTATVRTVVGRFLRSADPEVLALKGPWGVGKTYTWEKTLLDLKSEVPLESYSYVSLFGASSIAELRIAIFTKARTIKSLGQPVTLESINTNWLDYLSTAVRGASQLATRGKDLGYLRHFTVGLETVASQLVSKTLICFDDFERLSDRVPADELLGFISSLKEERHCKVVLIFNDQHLREKEAIYAKYREKLVDIELLFSPTAQEAVDIAVTGTEPWNAKVREHTIALNIRNIRVLRKISRLVNMVHQEVKDLHPLVLAQAIHSIALFAWCYYEPDSAKPSIDFVRKFNTFESAFKAHEEEKKGEAPDPLRTAWAQTLNAYGFTSMDEFDLTLLRVVEKGYAEETGLAKQAQAQDAKLRAADLDQSFTKIWDMYHYSFDNNETEFVGALSDAFEKSVTQITPLNCNGTVRLLRELGRDALANKLIDLYVERRGDNPELFNLSDYPFAGEIKDEVLKQKFNAKYATAHPPLSLGEAVAGLDGSGWSNAQAQALQAAGVDDFFDLFKQPHGRDLPKVIQACMQFASVGGNEAVQAKCVAALERIAKESKLNETRVNRYLKKS